MENYALELSAVAACVKGCPYPEPDVLRSARACVLLASSVVFALLVVACDWAVTEPRVRVDVVREQSGYVFRWKTKDWGRSIAAQGVSIERQMADGGTREVCRVLRTEGRGVSLRDSWRYGETKVGYVKTGCAPLEPGDYTVYLIVAVVPFAKFRINGDGSVVVQKRSSEI